MENDEVRNKTYAQLLKLPRSRSREYVENPTHYQNKISIYTKGPMFLCILEYILKVVDFAMYNMGKMENGKWIYILEIYIGHIEPFISNISNKCLQIMILHFLDLIFK